MAISVLLNPTTVPASTPGTPFPSGTSTESTGPQAAATESTAIGSFSQFQYGASVPQILFSGVVAGDYLFWSFKNNQLNFLGMNWSGFNWPQNFTATGGNPPSASIASTTGTSIVVNGAIPTGFAASGYLVVNQAGTTYVFSYSSFTASTFTLSNSGNSLIYSQSWNGTAVSSSTMSAGSTVAQYYLPIAMSGAGSGTTITCASNPIANGFAASGYVMVIHTPSATAASSMYVYSYTGTSSGGFTGCLAVSIGPTGTSFPITSLSTNDVCVPFYNPSGMYCISLNVALNCGYYAQNKNNTPAPYQMVVEVSSSLNLFPATTYTSTVNVPSMSGTPGLTTPLTSVPIPMPTPFAMTPTNLASITVTTFVALARVPGQLEYRVTSVQLNVNAITNPPNVVMSMAGVTAVAGGIGTINTAQPTVSWTYSDTDGLPQASYRVVVFTEATVGSSGFSINNPTPGNGTAFTSKTLGTWSSGPTGKLYPGQVLYESVLDTGDVVGTASSVTLAPAASTAGLPAACLNTALIPGTTYRIFVFVTAQGENYLYQTLANAGGVTGTVPGVGASNCGMDVLVLVEPSLMPSLSFPSTPGVPSSSYNVATGEIGPIAVRARQNLLSQADSDFLVAGTANTPGIGGWTYDSTQSTGTGSNPALTAAAPGSTTTNDFTPGVLEVAPFTTTTTQVAVCSSQAACVAGEILTATAKVTDRIAYGAHTTTGAIYLRFYASNGSTVVATVFPQFFVTVTNLQSGAQTNMPTLLWTQCKAPIGAAFVVMGIAVKAALTTGGSTPNWYIYQPMVTNNCINIADDPGMNSGAMNIQPLSSSTYTSMAPNSGFTFESTTTTGPTGSVVAATGPSNPNGTWAAQFSTGSVGSSSSALHTYYMVGSFTTDVSPWLMAVDAWSTNNFFTAIPAILGTVVANGSAASGPGTNIEIGSTPTRFTGELVPTATGAAESFGLEVGGGLYATNAFFNATNFQLERVWTLTDGGFDAFAAGTSIALSTALGCYSGNTAANPGQWWQLASQDSGGGTATVQTGGQSSNCAVLTTFTTPTAIEQFFTVSGLTSITPSFYWKYTNSSGIGTVAYVEFFDSAGTKLSIASTPGTVTTQAGLVTATYGTISSFSLNSMGVIPVPSTAAYAHIVFQVNPFNLPAVETILYVDTVSITLTGTLKPSTPWLDGGWSQGGLDGVVTTYLQRSPDNVNWTSLRIAPNAAGAQIPAAPGFEEDYADYEFPGGSLGSAQTFYYRAFNVSSTAQSPYNSATLMNANSFAPSQWLLIDPLYGGNISLQVVGKVTFSTDENQTVLMPMGRGRKVVLGDSLIFGDTITLPLQTLNNTDFVALQAMYSKTYPLCLRSPDGEFWYVRATKRTRTRTWQGSYARPLRTYELDFETVDVIP